MRNFIKKITHPFLKIGLRIFYFKPRKFCYDGICIKVHQDVFPPHLTLSTKILLDFIKPLNLKDKSFLELGCGSGIISLLASKKGARTIATDINLTALSYLKKNAEKNNLDLEIIESNLFQSVTKKTFDYILINPPYYPKKPSSIKEKAWFCGENFEYFEDLFYQLPAFISSKNEVYMILSEDCELTVIKKIAFNNKITFKTILEKKVFGEKNFIFRLQLI